MDVTEHVKPPRAIFVPFMMGHHFGVPFHRELQRTIILEALTLIEAATESGEVKLLPIKWAKVRDEGKHIEARLGKDK
jgi:hypothetical protein